MRAVVTGLNGTVAPALARWLRDRGHVVIRWDRTMVPPEDPEAGRRFVEEAAPDCFFHVATGSPLWVETVAGLCAGLGVRFLFTSSVSVFSDRRRGPFPPDTTPDATDDYGRYKIECEERVRAMNPDAVVARLGWQIGEAPGSNTMVDVLHRTVERDGRIEASRRLIPSCSFLDDTAAALGELIDHPAGTYHLEGNPGVSFYEIASALGRRPELDWEVVATETPDLDNRMVDPRIRVRPITARL